MNTELQPKSCIVSTKRFHAFPAAGRFTCRCVVRMLVVIPRFCPAVQMKIDFLYAEIMNFADLCCSRTENGTTRLFFPDSADQKPDSRLHKRLGFPYRQKHVYKIANGWVLYCLFFQSAKMPCSAHTDGMFCGSRYNRSCFGKYNGIWR